MFHWIKISCYVFIYIYIYIYVYRYIYIYDQSVDSRCFALYVYIERETKKTNKEKRNKNLKEIIECTCIEKSKVEKFNVPSRTGKSKTQELYVATKC